MVLTMFSQTPIFRTWLKNKAIAWVQPHINGEINVISLRGNLFTYIQIKGLSIQMGGVPVIKVRRLFLSYDPFSILLRRIEFRQILLEEPEVNLMQQHDGSWNLSKLIKYKAQTRETSEKLFGEKSHWKIDLPKVQIIAGTVDLINVDSEQWEIPKKVKNIRLNLGLWVSDKQVKVSMERLSFKTEEPYLKIQKIHAEVKVNPDSLVAQNIKIETESSKLLANFDIKNFNNPIVNIFIKGYPISMSELRQAVPTLKIYGDPRLDIEVRGTLSALDVNCSVNINDGKVEVKGKLKAKEEPYVYDLSGKVSKLNLAELTNQPDLSSNLNFDFQIRGTNLEWGHINADFLVRFEPSYAFGKYLNKSVLRGEIKGDSLNFQADVLAEGASSTFVGNFIAKEDRPVYRLKGRIEDLNLSRILNNGVNTNINMDISLAGSGMNFETMAGNLNLRFGSSQFHQVYIDSANFDFSLKNQIVNLKDFAIFSPLGTLVAEGNVSIQNENNLRFEATFTDFSVLSNSLPVDSLWGKGTFFGKIEGPLDSLMIHANCDLNQIGIEELAVGQFQAEFSGLFSNHGNAFEIEGEIFNATAFNLDSLDSKFRIENSDSKTNYEIELKRKNFFNALAKGKLALETEGYRINLEDFGFDLFDQKWQKVNDETEIRYVGSDLSVSELILASNDQFITILGRLDSTRIHEVVFKIENIDISQIVSMFNLEPGYKGRLDFETKIFGSLKKPALQGKFKIEQGRYFDVDFEKFLGSFDYKEDRFNWNCLLAKNASDSLLESSGFLPMKLSLSPFEKSLFYEKPVEFKISTRGLDLSFLEVFTKNVSNIGGTLVCDVVVRNTMNDLRGVGPIRLINGEFDIKELGTKYRNVTLVLVLKDKELIIRDFQMRSGHGNLKIVEGSLSLSKKYFENFNALLEAKNFQLMNNKKMQAAADGKINLSGSIQSPKFSGKMTVNRSRIYYPAWLEEDTAVRLTENRFFIISSDTFETDTTGAIRFQKSVSNNEGELSETRLYKNLRGELTIYFPRNTWIRSEEANIEVEGEIVLVKEGQEFVLYGTLSAVRGYYELLGNRFHVREGELVFNGEPEPNPEVHIEAVYEFRDLEGEDRKKREIRVLITGTQKNPQFKFTLDDQETDQKDILSYLLFGRNFDELTFGQRNSLSENTGLDSQARGFLEDQAVKLLTQFIGKGLSLDILEFERGKDWAEVRVGKYVTPDVFISVSQDFGTEGEQKVELEYEIPKKILFFNLFLQASKETKGDTGLDVIWKFEW